MDAERRKWTVAEVSRMGPGVTHPEKPPKDCGGFQWKESGYAGLPGDWLLRDESGKSVWQWPTAERWGMPWNGKEEKIVGTGCNHHEMMVATKREIL